MLPQARRRRLAMADAAAQEVCNTHGSHNGAGEYGLSWCLCDKISAALAQAHAKGRAEGLEAAARLFEAKAAELRKSNYPPTHLAAYEYDDHADSIRALAGQPSGDAKGK
jgi:hypothetical protein